MGTEAFMRLGDMITPSSQDLTSVPLKVSPGARNWPGRSPPTLVAAFLAVFLGSCGYGKIDAPNNQSTNDQINAAAANISEAPTQAITDQQVQSAVIGPSVRQSATVKPPKGADVAIHH